MAWVLGPPGSLENQRKGHMLTVCQSLQALVFSCLLPYSSPKQRADPPPAALRPQPNPLGCALSLAPSSLRSPVGPSLTL